MAKVIVEPDDVKRFARELARFREELGTGMTHITARMNALGETWRDQEHRKFADEFEQTLRVLARFDRSVAAHVPYLIRKAEKAQDYLDQG